MVHSYSHSCNSSFVFHVKKKMTQKKNVGRSCFFFSQFVYRFICFIGCTVQITQISFNYFKFQVNSNIQLSMPGKEKMKALNICFPNHQVIDYWKYQEIVTTKISKGEIPFNLTDEEFIIQSYLTIKERLKITFDVDQLFKLDSPPQFSRKFIISEYICYQMYTKGVKELETEWGFHHLTNVLYADYKIMSILLQNVTKVYVLVAQRPFMEFFLKIKIRYYWKSFFQYYAKANSYKIGQLEWPYVDNCINYPRHGFKDKRDAISSCINEKSLATFGKVARLKEYDNLTAVDYPMAYFPWHEDGNKSVLFSSECSKMYYQPDCEHETTFTSTRIALDPLFNDLQHFYLTLSDNPSYDIQSQPKIENVDYVTYIFGALGIWFGFSFFLINPINYFLQSTKDQVTTEFRFDYQQQINYLKRNLRLIIVRSIENETDRRVKETKYEQKIITQNLKIRHIATNVEKLSRRIDRILQ